MPCLFLGFSSDFGVGFRWAPSLLLGLVILTVSGPGAAEADAPPMINRVMGIGEARNPEPFTREQRFLHAVRQKDRATVLRALELGVSIDTVDDLGRSAPLLAVRDAESLELLTLLHERGAPVDQPDLDGRTPLSYAAARGRLDLIRFLIAAGAEVDSIDEVRKTPIFYAATSNHPDAIRLLHKNGAQLDARERFQRTPLIAACEKNAEEAARVLLELGADPSLVDHKGRSAKDRARQGTPSCQTAHPES